MPFLSSSQLIKEHILLNVSDKLTKGEINDWMKVFVQQQRESVAEAASDLVWRQEAKRDQDVPKDNDHQPDEQTEGKGAEPENIVNEKNDENSTHADESEGHSSLSTTPICAASSTDVQSLAVAAPMHGVWTLARAKRTTQKDFLRSAKSSK